MKAINKTLFLLVLIGLAGCSANDEPIASEADAADVWNECRLNMQCDAPVFDNSETRAEDYEWPDNARVYINFTKADNSSTYGSALYNKSTQTWTLSYNGRLDAQTPLECKVYYFEGGGVSDNALHTLVTPSTNTAIYGATGSYSFSDGNVNLSVSLAPLTSRIRFKRGASIGRLTGNLRNVVCFSNFDVTTCEFVKTNPLSSISVTINNGADYSDYIYGFHDFSEYPGLEGLNEEVRVRDGSYVYSYELPKDSDFMKIGESGYMNWPTPDFHNGWYSYPYGSVNKLFNISTGIYDSSLSFNTNVEVHKFDVIRVTICPDDFYGNGGATSSFKLYVGSEALINMDYLSPLYPGIDKDKDYKEIYYVAPSDKSIELSWYASYWYSYRYNNYVDHVIF